MAGPTRAVCPGVPPHLPPPHSSAPPARPLTRAARARGSSWAGANRLRRVPGPGPRAGSPGAGGCWGAPAVAADLIMVEAVPGRAPRGPGLALLCRQKVSGSGMAGTVLPLCLLLAAALRGALTQAPGHGARPGPLLLRLRRLEEQVGDRVGEGVQPGPCQGGTRRFGPGLGLAALQGPGTEV